MRYYDITLTASDGTLVREWTSYPILGTSGSNPTGTFDPGAQNVIFDFPMAPYAEAMGFVGLTIEGVGLDTLYEASNFVGLTITVKGGMGKGLPLAHPEQAGVLLIGSVFQAFGNWEGTDMRLELVITNSPYAYDLENRILFNWPAGTPLSSALSTCFSTYFPTFQSVVNIGAIVLNHTESGHYRTLEGLARTLYEMTGVSISIVGNQIIAYDGSKPPTAILLDFNDFIGQPTWIAPGTIQIKLVMRADLNFTSVVQMPKDISNVPGFVVKTQASYASVLKYKTAFQHNFQVNQVRHLGSFRSPDARDWVTIINAFTSDAT